MWVALCVLVWAAMKRSRPLFLSFALAAACAPFAGCAENWPDVAPSDSSSDAVNYRSTLGREFAATGASTVILTGDDAALEGEARTEKATALARAKKEDITRALQAKLLELVPEAVRTKADGLAVMLRASSHGADAVIDRGEGVFGFNYRAECGGPLDLLKKLPLEAAGEGKRLPLTLGSGDTKEDVVLTLTPEERSPDAYPRYLELFEDGLDIGIHVGGDHGDPRGDTLEARAIYDDLVKAGLKSPVRGFDDLALDSGPLTGTLDVGGKAVAVRATLFHQDMVKDGKFEKLVDAYKESAKKNDVVVYRGHAGLQLDYSGIAVSYNPRVALPASEFKNLELPSRYQIFVYDGCETYYGYADKLYENTRKKADDTSIVTTVNYAGGTRAEATRSFLRGLLDTVEGTWLPHSWDGLLTRLNDPGNASWLAIYGVHGIDGNPKASPLGKPETVGKECTNKDQCPGIDSRCVTSGPTRVCGIACTDDSGCPKGAGCYGITGSALANKQCLPR